MSNKISHKALRGALATCIAAFFRSNGRKGGKARNKTTTKKQRQEWGMKGALTRWGKKNISRVLRLDLLQMVEYLKNGPNKKPLLVKLDGR